jgi:Holliday junction resolvasome RuvABC endonuclease subunit
MNQSDLEVCVLAIHPNYEGFGFVVFESGEALIDWGFKTTNHSRNIRCMKLIEDLIERHRPDAIVIEDLAAKTTRRGPRLKMLLGKILRLAARQEIQCRRVSRATVKEAFGPTLRTKHQVACAIVARFPELARWLPKPRKLWMKEDRKMNIFSAVALALTFFRQS